MNLGAVWSGISSISVYISGHLVARKALDTLKMVRARPPFRLKHCLSFHVHVFPQRQKRRARMQSSFFFPIFRMWPQPTRLRKPFLRSRDSHIRPIVPLRPHRTRPGISLVPRITIPSYPSISPTSPPHLHLPSIRARALLPRNPQHIIAPDQHLAQHALRAAVDPLLGAAQLHVHVAVDADQAARVLGRAPLEADAHVAVDERLQHRAGVEGDGLRGG